MEIGLFQKPKQMMKSIKKSLFPLILLLFVLGGQSFGQDLNLRKISEVVFSNVSDNIVSISINSKTRKVCRVFSNQIEDGDKNIGDVSGIITEDGNRLEFKENEHFLSWNGDVVNTIYEKATNEDEGVNEFFAYQLVGRKLRLIKNLKFEIIGLPHEMLNDGNNIVINDYQSDYGLNFVFFDNKLNHLNTYTPSKKGIDFYALNSDKNKTVIVSKISQDSLYKIAYFDNKGNLIKEKEFIGSSLFRLDQLFIIEDYIVLYGTEMSKTEKWTSNDLVSTIYCINPESKLVWKKSLKVYISNKVQAIAGTNQQLFIVYDKGKKSAREWTIGTILPENGRIFKEINLLDNYLIDTSQIYTFKDKKILISEYKKFGDKLIIGLGKISSKADDWGLEDSEFIVVDKNLNVTNRIKMQYVNKGMFGLLEHGKQKLSFLNSNKKEEYEY